MAKKLKPWKQLTIGEQNYFYYVYKGYSKMTGQYDLPNQYKNECEKRSEKERKLEEKNNVSYYDY
jgi:hypothetical protein|tara:strand:+ start:1088 stop:1282 length:195 start_codon:yes stop_codon:yes gene_type:complete